MRNGAWSRIATRIVEMLRFNVLTLIFFGYGLIGLIFLNSVRMGTPPDESYEFLKEPIMAMIGGTLAIAKDLIPMRNRSARDAGPTDSAAIPAPAPENGAAGVETGRP